MRFDYLLAESVLVVKGTVKRTVDSKLPTNVSELRVADAEVSLGLRGDEGNGPKSLEVPDSWGDDDFSIELTSDRRISSVSFSSTGVGGAVVKAGGTLLATIVGAALRAGALGAAFRPSDASEADPKAEWEASHPKEAERWKAYAELRESVETGLLATRQQLAGQVDGAEAWRLAAKLRSLELVNAQVVEEIQKFRKLYEIWRGRFRTTHEESYEFTLALDSLPSRSPQSHEPPDVNALDGAVKEVWETLGIVAEVGPALGRVSSGPGPDPASLNESLGDHVYWRVGRPVRLWIWKRAGSAGSLQLERSLDCEILDRQSWQRGFKLDKSFFGSEGVTIIFGDDGSLKKLTTTDKSAVGAFANALSGVPGQFASALGSVEAVSKSVESLRSADQANRIAALNREKDERSLELDLLGLDATEDDFAELKRLEQLVDLAEATTALADPVADPLAAVRQELAAVNLNRELALSKSQADLEAELMGIRAEVARLAAREELERLRGPI